MTTKPSARELLAVRVPRSADCALWCTDGELVRVLSTEVRPTSDLHLLDSERMTDNTKVGMKSPGLSLALIGNASGQSFGVEQNLDPRRFR
jgi:hypothetical protein